MVSSYSTDLKLELMVTGENAGLWGDITNTNLNILQQAIAGYQELSIAGGAQTTALVFSNGILSNGKNAVIKLTGTITGNQIVTIPDGIEKTYIINNGTTGAFTVQIKTVSGTGPTFATTDKGFKSVFSDGTNVVDVSLSSPPGGSNTQVQFNNGGTAFGGSANFTWDGSNVQIGSQGDLRLGDSDNSNYVALHAPTTVASNYTLTLPTATGTANQVLITDGSGNLSFSTVSGGAAWQAVVTSSLTVVAKAGYFVNTSAAAITTTLPASPTLGDFISFVDYSGTFDTNNLTVARNGNKIQGDASDLTVATERAGFTLVYVDATQGWLLQNN
jgi:hypothetical protein